MTIQRTRCPGLTITAFTALVCAIATGRPAPAQNRIRGESGRVALRQAVRDAGTDRLVAVVATHPDDQWILAASYLRFHHGYRVAVILCTRGEGGQNITGPEVGSSLGRIRTRETEASAALLDCEVWYLNRNDGGFSRSGQETLEEWGRDSTQRDLARILREIQPDIVLTAHDLTDKHGNDQALLEVLVPAVESAESEDVEFDGLRPIRIHRVFRGAAPTRPDLSLPMTTIDTDRGRTYRQLADDAIRLHRSQFPIRPMEELFPPELRLVSLKIGERIPSPTLREGIPTLFDLLRERHISTSRITRLRDGIDKSLSRLIDDRQGLLELALGLRDLLLAIPASPSSELALRIARRVEALERVARHAVVLGARVEVRPKAVAVPGEPLAFMLVANHVPDLCTGIGIRIDSRSSRVDLELVSSLRTSTSSRFEGTLTLTDAFDPNQVNRYLADRFTPPVTLRITCAFPRRNRSTTTTLSYPIEVPVDVRPAIELEAFPPAVLVPDGSRSVSFAVRVRRNTQDPIDDFLAVRSPIGVQPTPSAHHVTMAGETLREFRFRLDLPAGSSTMKTRIRLGRFSTAVTVHRVSVSIDTDLRVGIIRGVDDAARTTLRALGVHVVELTDSILPNRDLSDLDSIVVDIRALRSEAARAGFNRLVDFVRAGGRLVVLYHKDREFNLESAGFLGFPPELSLHIGKGRVTQEDRPVEILIDNHPLMNTPNHILTRDWDGWVQERGLYFANEYSDTYDEVLSMSDEGFEPEFGSLLYGRTGQGEFVFCALALHRQLKNLHPGACRIFANLITPRTRR